MDVLDSRQDERQQQVLGELAIEFSHKSLFPYDVY